MSIFGMIFDYFHISDNSVYLKREKQIIMKKHIFIIAFLLGGFALSAQVSGDKLKTGETMYSYEDAVKALIEHRADEFDSKGNEKEIKVFPTVGQQISSIRQEKNLSILGLSYATGLSEEVIRKIEADKVVPTRDIIAKIESYLRAEIILDGIVSAGK